MNSLLYPTQHHSFPFQFTPSPSSLSAPHPFPVLLPPTSLSPQVVEMELGFGAPAAAVEKSGGDGGAESDFFVDDLLDFSNASLIEDPEEEAEQKQEDSPAVVVAAPPAAATIAVPVMPVKHEFESLPVSVPKAEDMESLEWLSHFVDDSFSEYSLTCPLTKLPPAAAKSQPSESEMVMVDIVNTSEPTPVQTKARTKRSRTGGRVWSLGSPSLSDSPSSSTSSTSTTTSNCSPAALSMLLYPNYQPYMAESLNPPAKRRSRKKSDGFAVDVGASGGVPHPQARRCSHCGVQRTPQWRSGPLGSKTLCNACGVRYKSGRLLPEYRPACSPTYSEQLHSNNHRKVMEMRRKKDGGETAVGPPVQSF